MTESFFDRIVKTGVVDFFKMILPFMILPILRMGPGMWFDCLSRIPFGTRTIRVRVQILTIITQFFWQLVTIVLARFMQIIPSDFCRDFAGRIINMNGVSPWI